MGRCSDIILLSIGWVLRWDFHQPSGDMMKQCVGNAWPPHGLVTIDITGFTCIVLIPWTATAYLNNYLIIGKINLYITALLYHYHSKWGTEIIVPNLCCFSWQLSHLYNDTVIRSSHCSYLVVVLNGNGNKISGVDYFILYSNSWAEISSVPT